MFAYSKHGSTPILRARRSPSITILAIRNKSRGSDGHAAGGPRTPGNLKLLGITATACAILLAIALFARP